MTLHRIETETEFNRVFHNSHSKDIIYFLYVSPWDKLCNNLLKDLNNISQTVNIIDSFEIPHSFVVFNVTSTPTLVGIDKFRRIVFYSYHYKAIEIELGLICV